MSVCKDCIHYDICQYHIDEETTMTVNECSHGFKHKDQYINLPVYVGQTVWRVYQYSFGDRRVEIEEGKVSMLQQKVDKSWKFRFSHNGSVGDFTFNDLGLRIFTSKKDAEEKKARLEVYHSDDCY
jgi:hypothetical protein